MASDPDAEPDIACRHLIICRTIWYDPASPDDGYSLGRIVVNIRPDPGDELPFTVARLFAYVQLYGELGDNDLRVQLVRVSWDEEGIEQSDEVATWGPFACPITGLDLVETHGFVLAKVPFEKAGLFEFQLWVDGHPEPIGWERITVRAGERE
jgi:hypothetical protein